MIITDIYSINKKDNNNIIFKINDICLNNKLKKMNSYSNYIYTYQNKYLIINDQNKRCFLTENVKNIFHNNYLVNMSEIKYVPVEHFPFIDKYHAVIKQNINTYYDKTHNMEILLINEISNNQTISFVRINDEIPQNMIYKIIDSILE